MTTVSVVLIVVAILALVVVAMAVQSLLGTLRTMRVTVNELRDETQLAVRELRAMVTEANGEIARVDSLLDTAEVVGKRVEATSRLAWLVMRNPLVKLASVSVATNRNVRRLSKVDEVEVVEPLAITTSRTSRKRIRRERSSRRAS